MARILNDVFSLISGLTNQPSEYLVQIAPGDDHISGVLSSMTATECKLSTVDTVVPYSFVRDIPLARIQVFSRARLILPDHNERDESTFTSPLGKIA